MLNNPLALAILGTTFTFLGTAVGSALVFFTKKESNDKFFRFFLGFAAGVMVSATIWSLLIPAIEISAQSGKNSLLPSCLGIIIGAMFLFVMDMFLPHNNVATCVLNHKNKLTRKSGMLVFAVTLHNIPEGIAVGLTFAACANGSLASIFPAITLAIGMALQNLPEGAAISLPLKSEGTGKFKSFAVGALSGVVEPLAGVVGVLLAGISQSFMPWMLAFAGGAMLYVVFEELIPDSQNIEKNYTGKQRIFNHLGTIGAILGFVVMMLLDLALG